MNENEMTTEEVKKLEILAYEIRKDVIVALKNAKSGHTGGSLGLADIFTALYFKVLHHKPEDPDWAGRDRFLLSNGHVCPVWYAALARAGYFDVEEFRTTLRKLGTRFQGHPSRLDTPGVESSSGSLGQGLSIGVGMAYSARFDNAPYRVYVGMSDAEFQEGSVWEALMAGGNWKLDNLTAYIDRNRIQIDGSTEGDVMPLEPLKEKLRAFKWNVIEADGHDIKEIVTAFREAGAHRGGPTMIIFNTVIGKGVSFMEGKAEWHGKPPNEEEAEKALKELDEHIEEMKEGGD